MVTLSNGLRVANFSSPHPFNFVDGTVLPAVDKDTCDKGALECIESEVPDPSGKFVNISIIWKLTHSVTEMIQYWQHEYDRGNVDVVLIPFPVLTALREEEKEGVYKIIESPFRVIRCADRITKAIFIDRFCI
jgi:hypothetical protein